MTVYALELLHCKFCPGVLKPDLTRKQTMSGFLFWRCEACDQPNIFANENMPARRRWAIEE